ncbi:UNVERIFIED_CONTAM: hypothetical protein Sradi_2044100 [Sesamum radiatum]|uniref:CCHC-type domain-containing protein n=1 Tax=Sesamum radiatum TaxID=300843 RepID=A0AAW2THM1_SESRA
MKRLRGTIKRTPLCCDNNNFPTIIGESSEPGRGRSKTTTPTLGVPNEPLSGENHDGPNPKPEPTKLGKGPDQQGLHPKDLDEQIHDPHDEPAKRIFRRAHTRANESFKDCNWTCRAKDHISQDCPQKRGELCKFESTNDILDTVYYGDLVLIYQFDDIHSDESVYEEEIETDSDGSSTELE